MTEEGTGTNQCADALNGEPVDYHSAMPGTGLVEGLTQLACHKWLIIKVVGIAMVAGVLCSLMLPVLYTATTKIMPPQQTPSAAALLMSQLTSPGAASLVAATGGGLGLRNPNDIYIGLLNSRPIADAIIDQFRLASLYHARDMTAARKILAANTSVVSERSGFLAVSVTDRDKKLAADIANAYTEELRNLTKTLAVTEASQRRLFYEEQLRHAKEDLVAAELSFQQIQQKKGLVQLDTQAKAMIEGLANLHAQVAAKQVELQALRSYSTEQNPSVQLAENELSSLQGEVSRLEQQSHSSGSAVLGLQDVAGAGLEYLSAEHELQYRQIVFDLLLKQYDAARLDEAKDAAVIQVVELATPPDQRISPRRTLIVFAFSLVGFFGVCIYLYVRSIVRGHPEMLRSLDELKSAVISK